ncbi:MAG: hypothetical protein ABIH21_01155 [Patescibacteria group bacterium]
MDDKDFENRDRRLSSQQKVAFVILLVLGFGGILLGFKSFSANIRRPFDLMLLKLSNEQPFYTSTEKEQMAMEAMKFRDTDGDMLNDYDEFYVYKTSAFLSDTDSDGFDDYQEINSGNDPNCPTGKECGAFIDNSEATIDEGLGAGDILASPTQDNMFVAPMGGLESEEDITEFMQNMTIEQVRTMLISAGVSKEVIDSVGDTELRDMLNDALAQAREQKQQ